MYDRRVLSQVKSKHLTYMRIYIELKREAEKCLTQFYHDFPKHFRRKIYTLHFIVVFT